MSPEEKGKIYWRQFSHTFTGGENGSLLKQEGNKIIFFGESYDSEEQRQYSASASFEVAKFQEGLDFLQKNGAAEVTVDPPTLHERILMTLNPDTKQVDMTIFASVHQYHSIGFRRSVPLTDLLD